MIPESHVSPRLASKILLCGKAVRMLSETPTTAYSNGAAGKTLVSDPDGMSSSTEAVYHYLSSGGGGSGVASSRLRMNDRQDGRQDGEASSSHDDIRPDIQAHVSMLGSGNGGYSVEEMETFSKQCHQIMSSQPTNFVRLFEELVQTINTKISQRLWNLLRDKHGFIQFLTALRNTYLLGKGEFFQAILDGVLGAIEDGVQSISQSQSYLEWTVVKSAAKLLNLDEDSMTDVMKFRINQPVVSIRDFSGGAVCLRGSSAIDAGTESKKNKFNSVVLNNFKRKKMNSQPFLFEKGRDVSLFQKEGYLSGAFSLPENKYVLKGFSSAVWFSCDWDAAFQNISETLRNGVGSLEKSFVAENSSKVVIVGGISVVLHDLSTSSLNQDKGSEVYSEHDEVIVSSPYDVRAASVGKAVTCGVIVQGMIIAFKVAMFKF
jgi:hypothetical protein